MLTENFKKRIQELAGILQEDNRSKLSGFGISDEVSNSLVEIDDALAMFLANITIREYAKQEDIANESIKDIIQVINQHQLYKFIEENRQKLNYIVEWIKSPFRQGAINLKDIQSVSQAYDMADEWHRSISDTGVINDESGEIIKSYPKEGLYWIDLQTNDSREESEAMGHCGKDSRATTMISLRDTKKSPHVTIAYNENKKVVTQVKGRKNEKPLPQYMKYVYDLLRDFVNKGELVDFEWSYSPHGPDLAQEEIEYVFKGNLKIYVQNILEKNLEKKTYTAPSVTSAEIIKEVGKDVYVDYVKRLLAKNVQNPYFGLTMTKGDIVSAVGEGVFANYIREMFDKAIEDPNIKLGMSKAELLKIVGEDAYTRYTDSILSKVLQNPIKNILPMTKDELFALLGEAKFKEYTSELLNKIVDSVNTEAMLEYILRQHGIVYDYQKIKAAISPRTWFFFLKRANERKNTNISGGGIS